MIRISYDMLPNGSESGTEMQAETILEALVIVKHLERNGYYNVTMHREEEHA